MKTIYIPSEETRTYDYLVADDLVVEGHLHVENGIKAKRISGHGIITADSVNGDTVTADEIECESIICRRLLAKRVSATEVRASDSAAVSCYLYADYVETGKLIVTQSQINEIKAGEVVHLRPVTRGLLGTLLLCTLRSWWIMATAALKKALDVEPVSDDRTTQKETAEQRATREEIAKTVREIMDEQARDTGGEDEDFELKRVISTFQMLRDQGYTLKVVPGTPEENAPVLDFTGGREIRPAA